VAIVTTTLPRLSLADIQPKMELKGIVKKIELIGAFVDVGLDQNALLHISRLKAGRVGNVHDVLSEEQEVTVWVQAVDREQGRVSLTMIKPSAVEWGEIQVGQVYTGKVVRIEKFGAFVDIGAERPGLVHVSELASGFVSAPADLVQKDQEVQVKVIAVNSQKNQIDLSMKALAEDSAQDILLEEESEEEVPTAMALALQRAFKDDTKGASAASTAAKKASRKRVEQDDLLRRTLEQHGNS
jgi:small subunit ribosomal protein S1